jgi:hypothetical protein
VILDTNGNIFGGFTPVEWESRARYNGCKADPSLTKFLFTLKNSCNVPARRFALKAGKKHEAPQTPKVTLSTLAGITPTTLDWTGRVFTGSWNFQVKEIEVFEITD